MMDDKTLPITGAMARALDETELTLQIQFALCIAQLSVLEATNHVLRADLKHEREVALANADDHLKVIADQQKQIIKLKTTDCSTPATFSYAYKTLSIENERLQSLVASHEEKMTRQKVAIENLRESNARFAVQILALKSAATLNPQPIVCAVCETELRRGMGWCPSCDDWKGVKTG